MTPVATFGNSSVIRSETAFGITAAPLGDTGAIVCYKDSVTGRGLARVARVSGEQILVGEEIEFSTENDGVGADSIVVAAMSSSTALISWRQATTNFGLMRVVSVGPSSDGLFTAISLGAESQFFPLGDAPVPKMCCLASAALSSSKVVLAYQDAFTRSGEAVLVAVSGLVASASDKRVILESGDASSMAVAALDENAAVVSYRTADGSGVAATVAVVVSGGEEELRLMASNLFLSPADINWISAVVSHTQGDDLAMSPHEDRATDRAGLSQVLARVVTTAQLISPEPGSVLIGTNVTFSWSAGVAASEYRLHIGTTPGGTDILFRSAGTNLSVIVAGLPDNGETLFVSLLSRRGPFAGDSDWAINEFVLTAFDATPPTTPPPFTTTAPPPTTAPAPTTAPPPTTAAPIVDSLIGTTATSISGTGVDGAIVEVFVDTISVGDADAPVAGGAWSKTGLAPLLVGSEVTARQMSLGELQSDLSDIVIVQAFSDAPSVNSPIFRLATLVSGMSTEGSGTPISVFIEAGGVPPAILAGSGTVQPTGTWAAVVPSLETGDKVTATAIAMDELESSPSAAVTVQAPVSAPPTVIPPIGEGDISINGTGANGGVIRIFVDPTGTGVGFIDSGEADASVAAGVWAKTGLALATGNLIKATQTQPSSSESGDSNVVTVQAFTAAPTVTFPIFDGDAIVLGTSTEADGTAIALFIDGSSAGSASVSGGVWAKPVSPLASGDQITATAMALGKLESPLSATAVVLSAITPVPILNSPIRDTDSSVTGIGVIGATVEIFVNIASVGFTVVNISGDWVSPPLVLSSGDIVKARQEIAPNPVSDFSAEVNVKEVSTPPTVDSPIFDVFTLAKGSRVSGTTVEVFINGDTVGFADVVPAGVLWEKSSLLLSEGDQIKAISTEFGKLESPDSNIVTVVVPIPPLLASPIADGDTSVNGTGVPGASIEVFIDTLLDGSADAVVDGGGFWERTGMSSLMPGQVVTARQTDGSDPQSGDSNPVIVQAFSAAPSVDGPIFDTQNSIFGTTTEPDGTVIEVFVNTSSGGLTTSTGGTWQKVLASPGGVSTGESVTATATGPGELESLVSAAEIVVAGTPATTTIPLTTTVPTTTTGAGPMVAGIEVAEINTCTRDIVPNSYAPGAPNTVTLICTIDAGITSTYVVEDVYPAGWDVSNISPGGVDNGTSVRWFFLDNVSRVLSYDATPPSGETGIKVFSGDISLDGSGGFQQITTGGETDTVRSGVATTTGVPATTAPAPTTVPGTTTLPGPNSCVRSFLDDPNGNLVTGYVPGEAFTVSMDCDVDPAEVSTYIVEDMYPAGWTISNITPAGGADNGISVRWFFLDSSDRILTYTVEPPLFASGDAIFSGKVDSDGSGGFINTPTTGDQIIGEFVAPATTTAPPPTTPPATTAPATTSPGTTSPGATTTAPATTAPPPPPGSFPDIDAGDVEHLTVSGLDGGRMLLAYRSNAQHGHGRAIVATATHDGTITFGDSNSFLGSRVEEVFSVPLSGDTGMVFYRVGTDIFAKLFKVVSITL